ncbi:hypothetical protein ACIQV3_19830 [Streptomyces sp. NPDC099050]|uniref:hypothetical protein n=1 Tax=Streptomyces sp. NPDC099050 TaxID=3366100 RepID=UPI00381F5BA9
MTAAADAKHPGGADPEPEGERSARAPAREPGRGEEGDQGVGQEGRQQGRGQRGPVCDLIEAAASG